MSRIIAKALRRGLGRVLAWSGIVLTFHCPVLAQCDPPLPPPPPPGGGVVLYSLNGQTVEANDLGDFFISNVAAPDVFPADFVGDDYLFLTGMRITDEGTTYYYSLVPFQINVGGRVTFRPSNLVETTGPPPLPESITATTSGSPVIEQGSSVALQTTARLGDGTMQDVTLPTAWTTYRVSNSRIGVVCQSELPPDQNPPECQSVSHPPDTVHILGLSPGTAFITATNGGATSVKQINVIQPGSGVNTTVDGFVIRSDGSMVSGAAVAVQVYGGPPVLSGPDGDPSWPDGFFSIPLTLPDTVTTIVAEATLQSETQTDYGVSPMVGVVPNGITDAGFIVIELFCDTPWSTAFGPPALDGGAVLAFAIFDDDGPGPNPPALFAGGEFTKAGGTPASRIAKWNGQAWEPLVDANTGIDGVNEVVTSMAVLDLNDGNGPALYVTGGFVTAGGIGANKLARWNGTNWSAIGVGVGDSHAQARAVTAFDDGSGNGVELYVGGSFATAGPVINNQCLPENGCIDAYSIAKWNPTTQAWSPVGVMGINTGPVNALAVFDDDGAGPNAPLLYIGGEFWLEGNPTVWNIAKWDGVSISGVGYEGLPGFFGKRVTSITVFDDGSGAGTALYVGGQFTNPKNFGDPDPVTVNLHNIARWDGSEWSALGDSLDDDVLALAGLDDGASRILFAAGQFLDTEAGGPGLRRVAQWNGMSWAGLDEGLETWGTALAVFDDGSGPTLHVGGEVCFGCGTFASRGDTDIQETGSTARPQQARIARQKKTQLAAARFVGYVASWRNDEWSALGLGLSDEADSSTDGVHALLVHDDGSGPALIAGGNFRPPHGPCAGLLGTCKDSLGTPQSNPPPFPTNAIAKFDGVRWSSLGTGMVKTTGGNPPPPADILALATFDEDGLGPNPPFLLAGGDFELADGATAKNVARWNGSSWSAVGDIGGIVRALAVFDDDGTGGNPEALYAGGDFPGRIARWNPSSGTWTALGSGISNGSVHGLAVFNNELYIGGTFTDAGGVPAADYLARWNGSTWSAVQSGGSGVNNAVYALHVFDRDGTGPMSPELYVGGAFTTAGGTSVKLVAQWDGSSWSQVGPASDPGFGPGGSRVTSLFGFESAQGRFLYAGGDFTESANGSLTLSRLAKWNPNPMVNSWSAVGNGVDGVGTQQNPVSIYALAAFDDGASGLSLFAGGSFETAGGVPSANIAKFGCR